MTTKQIFCALVLLALASLASLSPAPAADVPVHSVPTTEAAGGVALAVGAVLTAMARRREADASPEAYGATAEVWAAIEATLEVVPGYFESHLTGRSAAGDGSTCWRWGKSCPDAAAVLDVLLDTVWLDAPEVPNLLPGCKAFKAAIPGTIDLCRVADLAETMPVTWVDSGHGYQYPTIAATSGEYVDYTVLITGDEQGRRVVFTFHPGDPIRPSQVPADADTTAVSDIATLKAAFPNIEWVKVAHTA